MQRLMDAVAREEKSVEHWYDFICDFEFNSVNLAYESAICFLQLHCIRGILGSRVLIFNHIPEILSCERALHIPRCFCSAQIYQIPRFFINLVKVLTLQKDQRSKFHTLKPW